MNAAGDSSASNNHRLCDMQSKHAAELEASGTWRRAVNARADLVRTLLMIGEMGSIGTHQALSRCVDVCASADGAGGAAPLDLASSRAQALMLLGRNHTMQSPMMAEETLLAAEKFIIEMPVAGWKFCGSLQILGDTKVDALGKRDALLASTRCSLGYALNKMHRYAEALIPARAAFEYWSSGVHARGAPAPETFKATTVLSTTLLDMGQFSECEMCANQILTRSDAFSRDPARIFAQPLLSVRDIARVQMHGPGARAAMLVNKRDMILRSEAILAAAGTNASLMELKAAASACIDFARTIVGFASKDGAINRMDTSEALAMLDRGHVLDPSMKDHHSEAIRASLLSALGRNDEAAVAQTESVNLRRRNGVIACSMCGREQTTDKAPLSKCSGCSCVCYCSATCQKQDWPRHKVECKEMKKEREDGIPKHI